MYLIDDFDNEYNDSSNNLFDENMFINYDIEKKICCLHSMIFMMKMS